MYSAVVTLDATGAVLADTTAGTSVPGFNVDVTSDGLIFHLGDATLPTPANLGPYTAKIYNNGVLIKTQQVPVHYYYTDWEYQIKLDTVVSTPQQLISSEYTLPWGIFDPSLSNAVAPSPLPVYTGPMSFAGITLAEGTTGERPELGMETEMAAYWMQSGIPGPMLAWATAADSMPFYIRQNGKPIDLFKRPFASTYGGQSDVIPSAPPGNPYNQDASHHPETSFLAFGATQNIRHVRRLQYTATWYYIWSSFYSKAVGYAILGVGQTRETGQGLRTLLMTVKATQEAEKLGLDMTGLHPSTYWKALLDQELKFLTQYYMQNPACQTFRFFPWIGAAAVWMQDFVHMALTMAGLWYPSDWGPFVTWAFDNLYKRVNTKSGWPPAYTDPYRLELGANLKDGGWEMPGDPTHRNDTNFGHDGKTYDILSNLYPDWNAAWQAHAAQGIATGNVFNLTAAQCQTLLTDPQGGGGYVTWDPTAALYAHQALAGYIYLARKGKVDLYTPYPDIEDCYAKNHSRALKLFSTTNYKPAARHSLAVYPTNSNPNPGGISLPTSATINVGQTIHLGLQVDGALTSGPTYTVSNDVGTLTVDSNPLTGVTVKGLKAGTVTVTATAVGATSLSTTCVITVVAPLATTLTLVPGAIN